MILEGPTVATIILVLAGAVIALPVLIKGFKRAGKGVFYEQKFWIQRAPQLVSVLTIVFLVPAHLAANALLVPEPAASLFSLRAMIPAAVAAGIEWAGVVLLASGLVFMIGGWYSLGDMFSTDAEIQDNHTVRRTGMLRYVMHPVYSGIVQSLLGASLAAISASCAVFTLLAVAPLWLRRAKYEEKLLLETLGPDYEQYAQELKWRRLVPPFIPIGV